MKNFLTFTTFSLICLALAGSAFAGEPGFTATVSCDARALQDGFPSDASKIELGVWKETGERVFYVYSGTTIRVALAASNVLPDGTGEFSADLTAKDLDSGSVSLYGKLNIQLDSSGNGGGFMESAFAQTEPYVLGSLELSNCRKQ